MNGLLAVAFAILIAIELIVVGVVVALVGMFVVALWGRAPWAAILLASSLLGLLVWFWRAGRRDTPVSTGQVHPSILMQRIPMSGAAGSMYMLQFLVWALVIPKVGLFYAVLIGGGLLLVPVAYYFNRPGRGGLAGVGGGALLGLLLGLAFFSVVSARQVPIMAIFGCAAVAGVLGAVLLIWRRSAKAGERLRLE